MFFKTIEELKQFIRIPGTNISSKMPAIETAEEKYLLPILGSALYARIQAAYDAATLTSIEATLLKKCRAIIAPMSYLNDLPLLQANLSDNGIRVNETENTRSAFKWEYNEAKEALSSNGYSAMEMLIVFLMEYRADFPEWTSAPYNDADLVYLLQSGNDLKKAVALQQPHRCFLMLQPLLPMLAEIYIKPTIGDDYFAVFNQQIIDGSLSADGKTLASYLQPAMARLAMMQAAVELSLKFSGSGFTIVDILKDLPDDGRKDSGDARLERFRMEMERTANVYLDKAVSFLIKNADKPEFELYKTSEAYPVDGLRLSSTDNSKRKGIFVA